MDYKKIKKAKYLLQNVELGLKGLNSQTSKKPIKNSAQHMRYTSSYLCPTCGGGFIGTEVTRYCYHCGQRIDWEE